MSDEMMTVLDELEWRGLIDQCSNRQALAECLENGDRVPFYCGFDPTADALQVGNLLPILTMAHLTSYGHRPILLLGGATGQIGDPSGKDTERQLLDEAEVEDNLDSLSLSRIEEIIDTAVDVSDRPVLCDDVPDAEKVNNLDWFEDRSFLDLLRSVGKEFRVNQMINKESIQSRLEGRDQGITYTEFSYMILQAVDFLHLHRQFDCKLQVGGSDQWGNITAGIDLVRRKEGQQVFGLTHPLVTDSSGRKLGKSEGETVWLDPEKTSPYEFYQYWIDRPDHIVPDLLRQFTMLPREEIYRLSDEVRSDSHRGYVQKRLAREVTALVHGPHEADSVQKAASILHDKSPEEIPNEDRLEVYRRGAPSTEVDFSHLFGHRTDNEPSMEHLRILDVLAETDLFDSKSQVKRMIRQGGLSIEGQRVDNLHDAQDRVQRWLLDHPGMDMMIVDVGDDRHLLKSDTRRSSWEQRPSSRSLSEQE